MTAAIAMDDVCLGLSCNSDEDSGGQSKQHRRKTSTPRRSPFDAGGSNGAAYTHRACPVMPESPQGATCSACTASAEAVAANATETGSAFIDQDPALPLAAQASSTAPKASSRRTVVHRRKSKHDLAGPCNHCGALTSPQWRKGPKGKPVLCNACGIRFLRNRTLTKVMPKKRRQSAGPGSTSKRSRAAAEADGDDDYDDGMMTADDALTAADDGTEEALSALVDLHTLQPRHQPPEHSSLVMAAAAAAAAADSAAAAADETEVAARYADEDQHDQLSGLDHVSDTTVLLPARTVAVKSRSAATTVSRQLLLGRPSRNLLAELGDCPSLALALALHQQQQQQLQHPSNHSAAPFTLPYFPQLQLCAPGSPASESAVTGMAGAAASAVASPLSTTSGLVWQQQHQEGSAGSPPLSPLLLGVAGGVSSAPISSSCTDLSPRPAVAATAVAFGGTDGMNRRPEPQSADILQLVQQLGAALGGVGPAVEFLKLCSSNPAAVSAAVSAVAACTVTRAHQQQQLL